MSFTDNYLALYEEEKKKKKKKTTAEKTGHSFTDKYLSLSEQEKEESVAPVFVNKTAPALYKADDIAPVAKKEEDEERTWFRKGAFDDGYQFGDVTKTILGTASDLGENLAAGVLGMGERVVDAGAYLAGGVGKMFGADEFAEDTKEFISKDLYNEEEIAKKIIIGSEENSVLGEKSDSLVQSAGQLGATMGLQAVGVPWFVTTGLTSFGGEVEGAFNEGASFGEAGLSAAISAGAEILTEKISGGISFGGKTLDDALTKNIARNISNKTVRTLSKLGLDMAGEGAEELLSGVMGAIGQKITYADDKELTELFSKEEALESFIGGAVLGGGMGGINAVKSGAKGVDYASGLTANEEKVVNKVYEDRVAEAEKSGKLSEKEKSKIYDEVLGEMEKGGISTDTIEEVLGGDTYQTYQNTVKNEDSLRETFNQLNQMKQGEMTGEQIDLRNELKEQLKEMESKGERNQLKSQLGSEVMSLVQGDRLIESYNERARKGQAFEADLTKYNEKQRAVVQKAIDSGILNNTRRTHEFVDMVSKISADKGVLFDFANNAKLKESGFAVDGKTVNGFVTKDGVTLNIDAAKSLNSVVGHEITHVLEGTELYTALQSAVVEYAKTKGDYQGRYDSITKLYEGIEGANVDAELTADLVGDYLFTDSDFINNLSTNHRNVFQKIYDEVKYLCKVATAGSKEARELEKVKRAFEKAYKADSKAESGTKYSVSDSTGKELSKEQQEYFKDSKMRDENGNLKVMYHGSQDAGFHVFDASMSDDDTSFFFVDRNDVAATYSGTSETYEAKAFRTAEDANKFFADIGKTEYEVVEKDGKYTLYDDGDEVATSESLSEIYDEFRDWEGVGYGDANYKVYLNLKNPLVVDAQGRNWNNVSREFSQSLYDRYKTLTDAEKEHLTQLASWEDIGVFRDEILDAVERVQNGDTEEYTLSYANAHNKLLGDDERVNMYDLFDIASEGFTEESIKANAVKANTTRDYAQKAKEQGYDGVIFNNIVDVGGYGNGSEGAATVAIAFDSNQIKSVANEKPTADKDIRFSLSKSVEETKDLMAIHNLHTSELLKQLEMGGMPYPSVAITKPGTISHDEFGEITLVLRKDAIDPKKNKYNHVYGADAWTPTFPHIAYEASEQVAGEISAKVNELYSSLPDYYQRSVRSLRDFDNIDDELNRWGSEQGLVEKYENDYGMKQLYLAEKGETVPVETKRTETRLTDYQMKLYQTVVDKMGADVLNSFNEKGNYEKLGLARVAWLEQHGDALKDIYAEDWSSDGAMTKEEALDIANSQNRLYWRDEIYRALEFIKNNGVTVKEVEDISGTNAKIDEKIADSDYKKWLGNLFRGIEGRSGIRNNKDMFTPSGNRRSFAQLYDPVTVDNIVKAMRKENQSGQGAFGGGNIQGASAQEYGSIAEIKKNSGRLGKMDDAEYEAISKRIEETFFDIAKRYSAGKDIIDAQATIAEAVSKSESKAGIARYLKQYDYVYQYTDAIGDEIIALRDYIRSLPTPYFEAKPRRAVGFDEIGVYVIPYDADVKLKQELLNRGYSIAEYDPKVEGDRQRVVNGFEEYKFSLSDAGVNHNTYGSYNVFGKDIALEAPVARTQVGSEENLTSAPVSEVVSAENATTMFPDDLAPVTEDEGRIESLTDADAPPETEAPYYEDNSEELEAEDPFEDRDWYEVSNRKVKAYMYDHPEVKPFFQAEAAIMLDELTSTTKGEKWYDDHVYYESGGEAGWGGTKRHTSDSIATMLDSWNMSYADIEKGLRAIIEDHGAENIAAAKKIEFMLNERLLNGYKSFVGYEPTMDKFGRVPQNQDYINMLAESQIVDAYSKESFDALMAKADKYAPPISEEMDDIAPVAAPVTPKAETPKRMAYEAIRPKKEKQPKLIKVNPDEGTANVMTEEPEITKKKRGFWSMATELAVDKGAVFETLALKTGNRELQARYNSIRYADARAQRRLENDLKPIMDTVTESGKTKSFYEYLYHMLNVDRMTLADRYDDVPNKPVFGNSITADKSMEAARRLERANPEFKQWAEEVYEFNRKNREMLVEGGVISQELADHWEKMYPHYVPIRRAGDTGLNVNVPLDTGRTGVNAPIKRATGGSRDILPLFDTMGQRTIQTYKAIAKNRFGVELKNTLGTPVENEALGLDEAIDSVDTHEELLQEGKNGKKPTFTVFENGEKVTFEITDEMYSAMKPTNEVLARTNKTLNAINNFRRGTLTEYNPWFLLKNAIKDSQDVLINSQHPARTYAAIPKAIAQMTTGGQWYQEYLENGGDQNSYFDGETNTFAEKNRTWEMVKKFTGLEAISKANNIIERLPRLAEYIASREAGNSVDVSMLDAARVTTNFAAGGDLTKFLNRNGATFLNASVQGATQQVRNIREAKMNGLRGWASLAGKFAVAGIPALILNNLMWDDDEEYEELSDYVKEGYYIVGKYGDGKFVRIPKGRTVAVIQNAIEQISNAATGNDEVDLRAFVDLVITNLAPNNPLDNNILSPIVDVATNEAWYGEDLVPTRLQDLPKAEQYDESTDSLSRWLGETFNISPVKANYLLDQYSGVIGDTFLPMLTPEAESGDNTAVGNMIAPLKDMFTTDSVMNNQNVSDFYDTKDELTTNAKKSDATDEDILMSKYMNSVNSELSKLYALKREVQTSDLPDDRKYNKVREIQEEIVSLTKEGLATYEDVYNTGNYAVIGDRHYIKKNGEWTKLTDKQVNKQDDVIEELGISGSDYWSDKDEYDFAYEYPEKYTVAKSVGGFEAYKGYQSELYDIKADKDENGDSIRGSRKEKVADYINNLDADYGVKIILFKSEYNADDTYNYDIIEYLNGREDISYEEMETILKELGFDVDSEGNVSWD